MKTKLSKTESDEPFEIKCQFRLAGLGHVTFTNKTGVRVP